MRRLALLLLLWPTVLAAQTAPLCRAPLRTATCVPTGTCMPSVGDCGMRVRHNLTGCADPGPGFSRLCATPDGRVYLRLGGSATPTELGTGATLPLLQSRGALITSDGAQPVVLAAGTDGQVPIYDSTQPAGIRPGTLDVANGVITIGSRIGDTTVTANAETSLLSLNTKTPAVVGQSLHFLASGTFTRTSGSDTLTYRLKVGGVTVCELSGLAPETSVTAPWRVQGAAYIRTIGVSGIVEARCDFFADETTDVNKLVQTNTTSVDLSGPIVAVATATLWSGSTAGNSMVEKAAEVQLHSAVGQTFFGGTTTTTSTTTSTTTTTVAPTAATSYAGSVTAGWSLDAATGATRTKTWGTCAGSACDLTDATTTPQDATNFREGTAAANFANTNFITCGDATCTDLRIAAGDSFTAACFGRPTQSVGGTAPSLLSKMTVASCNGWRLFGTTGDLPKVQVGNGCGSLTNLTGTATLNVNAFSFVAATFDNANAGVGNVALHHFQGSATDETTSSAGNQGDIGTTTTDFTLSSADSAAGWRGQLDECFLAKNKVFTHVQLCRVCAGDLDGAHLGSNACNGTAYRACAVDADCGNPTVTGACDTTRSLCQGRRDTDCGGCTLPNCNASAP